MMPVRLPPNPVWRSYLGGRVLRGFRGMVAGADDHFPEDWIASTTRARNGPHAQAADEGISRVTVSGREVALPEALGEWPAYFRGSRAGGDDMGVLIKLLDSSTRLHVQAHPDAAFVARRFGGTAGKTECWYILSTRGDGYVYLGFQHAPTPSEWKQLIEAQDTKEMLACFERIPVRAGDCYVVPAGTPHAIGEGVFMVELQEPTDWVVRCEFEVGAHRLPPEARSMGLALDECLEIFDYDELPLPEVRRRLFQAPRPLHRKPGCIEEEIIEARWHGFFRLRRVCGAGPGEWTGGELAVMIVTEGAGRLHAGSELQPVRAGETWLLPGGAEAWQWEPDSPRWEALLAMPPPQ
jgi:mannose-6-phosphate isomerase